MNAAARIRAASRAHKLVITVALGLLISAGAVTVSPGSAKAASLATTAGGAFHHPTSPDADPPVVVHEYHPCGNPLMLSVGAGDDPRALDPDFILCGDLPEGDSPAALTYTPDGLLVVIAHRESRNLILLDAATQAFVAEIPLTGGPVDVAISPDGLYAVTANPFEDTASIVDMGTRTEIAVVPVGDQPGLVAISPDGTTAAVGNTVAGSVSILDLAAGTESDRIAGLGYVGSVSFNFESGAIGITFGRFFFVDDETVVNLDTSGDQIQFVDLTSSTVTNLPCTDSPRDLDLTADRTLAVVSHTGSAQTITTVDLVTQTIKNTYATGVDLWGAIDLNHDGSKAAFAVQNACRILELASGRISPSINTAGVYKICTTADGLYALTIGYRGSLISYATEEWVKDLNNTVSTPVGNVSPTEPRAAMAANVFGEDAVFVNTNGASGYLESVIPSGAPPEGDAARLAAVSMGGDLAVVTNIFSDNASLIDPVAGSVLGIVAVGDRPAEVEITPNAGQAVVANLDAYYTSVIDVAAQTATNISMGRRGSEVEISPDGQYAYVAVVADGDGVYRINLETLALEGAKILTGDMGGIYYSFSQASGMTLSHDGATLVTCDTYDDTISLIDTATWSLVATVAVGDFPARAVFSPDDGMIFVSNRNSDTVSAVVNDGASSYVSDTFSVGDQPFELQVSPSGLVLYVLNFGDQTISFVETATGATFGTASFSGSAGGMKLDPIGSELYVASGTSSVSIGPGPVIAINRTGSLAVIDTRTGVLIEEADVGFPASDLVYDGVSGRLAFPSPVADGLFTVQVGDASGIELPPMAGGLTLRLASPQPARDQVALRITSPAGGPAELMLFDVAGRQCLRRAADLTAGRQTLGLELSATPGAVLRSGVYFARIESAAGAAACRFVVVE